MPKKKDNMAANNNSTVAISRVRFRAVLIAASILVVEKPNSTRTSETSLSKIIESVSTSISAIPRIVLSWKDVCEGAFLRILLKVPI